MIDETERARILSDHTRVGPSKPISYLPIRTVEKVLKIDIEEYVRLVSDEGGVCAVFSEADTCIESGAVYAYDQAALATLLWAHSSLLGEHGWSNEPATFVKRLAAEWLDEKHPLMDVIKRAFANYPLSVKGVVIHDGCVLLLLNERGEWDLPGGRPDPGEEHRAALKREVWEEAGLDVEVGVALEGHLFEVLPGRFVRIEAFVCTLAGPRHVTLSREHQDVRWVPLAELGETVAGHPLPTGYLGAIRQVTDQPRSPSDREV